MDAMPMLRTVALARKEKRLPLGMPVAGTGAGAEPIKLEVKEGAGIGRQKRTSGTAEMFTAVETQPVRAPVERGLKSQTLIIRDDVQRVVDAITVLARSGDIDQAQSSAAERWYRDYVMGVVGARDPEAGRSGRAPDIHASMLARSAAIGRCRTVRNGLGLCGEVRLKLLLIDELSFSAIAQKLLPNDVNGRKKIAAQMVLLLEQLSELYATLDRRSER